MTTWLRAGLMLILAVLFVFGAAPMSWNDGTVARAQDTSTAMVPNWAPPEALTSPARAAPEILTVRLGDHGIKTRFVLEMSDAADYRIFALEDPDRMVIDFDAASWRAGPSQATGVGLITGHRHGAQDGNSVRVVLDLAGPARVMESFYLPAVGNLPYRFVLDLAPAEITGPASVPTLTPSPSPSPQTEPAMVSAGFVAPLPPPLPPERARRHVVAIDAGHGGIDPGAIGVTGLREKELTLDIARRLRTLLEATGRYEVVLTRERDEFLRLRERVQRSRDARADLLISLHADSISDASFRGASVYTLSDVASDREAELLAARENRADALAGVALDPVDDITASILIDLAQRHTHNESSSMAQNLVTHLGEATRMVSQPNRQAGFAVLKAPDVPSALVELGYLSNRYDEQVLRSSDHRAELARAIANAIERHFDWREHTPRS